MIEKLKLITTMKYFVVSTLLMAVAVNGGLLNLGGILSGGGASTTGGSVHTAENSDGESGDVTRSITITGDGKGIGGSGNGGSGADLLGGLTSTVDGTLTGAEDVVKNLTGGLDATLGGNSGSGQYFCSLISIKNDMISMQSAQKNLELRIAINVRYKNDCSCCFHLIQSYTYYTRQDLNETKSNNSTGFTEEMNIIVQYDEKLKRGNSKNSLDLSKPFNSVFSTVPPPS